MADLLALEPARYRAFISYSHRDAEFGRRLHSRLERYVLPGRLVGRETPRGPVPKRAAPIFRDREEFSAAGDLTAEVRAALAASGALIVVCSPHAAASPWVAREIELFRDLHPDRPVLAALAAGEPSESFPAPLRTRATDGAAVEPLAADFRKTADGDRLALLKLVAGVVGVGLDDLVQRDAQRRVRAVTGVTAGAVSAMLAMGALTVTALAARAEAQRQRAQAEDLVEFMLTDLRDRLKGVGRLDVLEAVNTRALRYYADQDVSRLPPESLERRARVLHAMGADDETRGNLAGAAAKFREAERTTATLLAQQPDNPDRIWAQGQSAYWLGFVAYRRQLRPETERYWGEYRLLSRRLATGWPQNPTYRKELAYAEGGSCSLALQAPKNPPEALKHCSAALSEMEAAAALLGGEATLAVDLINRHAWMADAYRASGDLKRARAERLEEERLLKPLMTADPQNMDLKETRVVLQRAMARLDIDIGRRKQGQRRISEAIALLNEMVNADPTNKHWKVLLSNIIAEQRIIQGE